MLNKFTNIFSKINFILKEEGLFILFIRSFAFVKFFLQINFIKRKTYKNDKIKDVYKNKRIFILGNGPSLNRTPLHLLKDEYVLCTNRFNLMLERLDFVPQFYACIDDRVLNTISSDIIELSKRANQTFLPIIHPSSGKNFYDTFKEISNVYWLILNKFGYSLDLPFAGINKSVTNCSLQIAAFMGFTEIYLLGVDMDYGDHTSVKKENRRDWTSIKDDDPNHFDPRYFGKGTKYHHPRLDETFKKWEEAKTYFGKMGINIYNSTVGGYLETFDRIKLEDAIGLTDEQEMLLFLKKFGFNEYKSNFLIDYFTDAEILDSDKEFKTDFKEFITDIDLAIKLIPKIIFDYIPYGPIFDQYIFIKREQ